MGGYCFCRPEVLFLITTSDLVGARQAAPDVLRLLERSLKVHVEPRWVARVHFGPHACDCCTGYTRTTARGMRAKARKPIQSETACFHINLKSQSKVLSCRRWWRRRTALEVSRRKQSMVIPPEFNTALR